MRKIYQIILIFLLIFSITFPFHITPTFFEKRIDGDGGYQEFTMYNNSTKTQRFKIIPLPGTGEYKGHMDKWIEFSPKIITIKPRSESTLKVYIKAPKGTLEGEYSTFLNFKSVPVPELAKDDGKNVAAAARMALNVNLEIVAYVGDLKPKLEISNLKISENKEKETVISFNVKNNTSKRGIWYNIDIIGNNDGYETLEKGRIGVEATHDIVLTMKKMKKSDISGIRLRDSSTYEEITKKKL